MATELQQEKIYKFAGVFWMLNDFGNGMVGPLCSECRIFLKPVDNPFGTSRSMCCANCQKEFIFKDDIQIIQDTAMELLYSRERLRLKVEALDLPVGRVVDKAEDENYWVEARLGQHKGKKAAVVYFGDKSKRGSKSQVFVDLEDEQIRFHAHDTHPSDIAAKLTVEFPVSFTEIRRRK